MNPPHRPPLSACPDENLLAAFASGSAPAGKVVVVEAHLDGCVDCRALVAAVAASSSLPGADASGADAPTWWDTGVRTLTEAPALREEPILPPGTRLGGYLLQGVLGMGGMGVVYAADDPRLGRRVALKLLRPLREGAAEEGRARLLREAQAMARLSHPNVLPLFELGAAEGRDFLAMEWVDGTTLADWLRVRARPWREVLEVFLAAGAGLAAAHRAGMVHRDFKPSNVMVGRDGRVRVTDFGLARHGTVEALEVADGHDALARSSVLTKWGQVAGTPAYMSPEQQAGRPVDARSDQYSFCVALHEALHGERPGGPPSSTASWRSSAPRYVRAALARGLASAPEDRFPNMDALMAALSQPAPTWRRRRLLTVAACLSALGVGSGVLLWSSSPPSEPDAGAPRAGRAGRTDKAPLVLRIGEARELSAPELERIAVGDPSLVEVELARPGVLRLTGQSEGATDLITWGRDGTMKSRSLSVIAP
ncbi:protein kinase domain-containing protein [Corallococcus macrosporus]|uniref:Serine/threonine protein kinase n=1 Tax=Corallococcus macrosporus DSM 14697 TaxID=1189310 RepID=A0A250JN16_9BACT|nr:protein kinase [Corallococcus macrosporus]ATB44506.1 serine/threonine protein kinase [Corallococcus macrosporus DSM 14697]